MRAISKLTWNHFRCFLIIILGLLAIIIGIYFPTVLSWMDPNITVDIGGTNMGVVFLFSSFMIGYYIGEMVRPEEEIDLTTTRDYGFAIFGIFLGFIIIFSYNTYISHENIGLYVNIGLFGSLIALMTFIANITDFIKNKKISEESFKKLFNFVGILGVYQYLISSYVTPYLQNINDKTLPYFIIVLLISLILIFIFLKEIREIAPDWVIEMLKTRIFHTKALSNTIVSSEESEIQD